VNSGFEFQTAEAVRADFVVGHTDR
jgi:hypothetical protein